jgi:predicted DNA-binding transcriptional regulator YafY
MIAARAVDRSPLYSETAQGLAAVLEDSGRGINELFPRDLGQSHYSFIVGGFIHDAFNRGFDLERGRQILRQWKVLRALESARRGLTVAEISEAIGEPASDRTLYRDLEQLELAGFPLINEDARWRCITEGSELSWSVPVNPTHVVALDLLQQLLEPLAGSWLAEPINELRDRLRVLLTPTGRAYCEELRKNAKATLFAPVKHGADQPIVDAIEEALAKEHVLEIEHASPNKDVKLRIVEPYATWYADARLYLVGRCRTAQAIRTFAVHRIQRAMVLDETFSADPSFDLDVFVQSGFGVFHDGEWLIEVELDASVAYLAEEHRFHLSQVIEPQPNGAVRISMKAQGLREIAAWVTSFGGKARAIAPKELREEVRRRHEEGLRVHGTAVTSDDTGIG